MSVAQLDRIQAHIRAVASDNSLARTLLWLHGAGATVALIWFTDLGLAAAVSFAVVNLINIISARALRRRFRQGE